MSLILVIEDDPRIQRALRRQFSAEGYDVHIEGEGPAGLAACKNLRPVTVVLDLMLPGLSGRTVCKEIKAWCSDIPVIVLSARDPQNNEERALRAGATAFFQKPADNDELLNVIRVNVGPGTPQVAAAWPS